MEITGKSVLTLVLVFILATGTVLSNPAALATTITITSGTSTLSTSTTTIPVSTVSQTSTSAVSTISETSTSAVSTVSQSSSSAVSTVSQSSSSNVSTISSVSESVSTITSSTVTVIPIAEIDEDYRCTAVDFSTLSGLICPIPQDIDGNFFVNAVLSGKTKTTVSSSNPGQLYKVFRIDSGLDTFNALSFTGTLPSNWIVNPNKAPGGVSVLFVPSGSNPLTVTGAVLSGISITQGIPNASNVCGGTPGSVDVNIPNITTVAGEPLGPGDTIYIWVKMQYGLKGQTVNPNQYPCTHPDDADATLNPGAVLVSTSGNLIVSKK